MTPLERELAALATEVDWPETPDVTTSVFPSRSTRNTGCSNMCSPPLPVASLGMNRRDRLEGSHRTSRTQVSEPVSGRGSPPVALTR